MGAGVDWDEFILAINNPETNAADLIAGLISDVGAQFRAHAATITDPVERAEYDANSAKQIQDLEGQLLTFQTSFDEIQAERKLLKEQIDVQTEVIVTQSIRELEDL